MLVMKIAFHNIRSQVRFSLIVIIFVCCMHFSLAVLDVTLVITKPVVAYNEEAVLKCVAENQYFQEDFFPFSVEADIGNGNNLTSDHVFERNEPMYWPGHQLKLPASSGASKYGFISCTARNNETDEETKVTGVVMSQNALVFPTSLNYRASINSSVTMAVVQARRRSIHDLFWFRIPESGTPKQTALGKLRVNINQVTEKFAGPYAIFYQVRDRTVRIFQQGMTRLVVRDCVENRYGENCTKECPSCENGGVCDDKNGTCICPPGFMGEWCEIGCGENRFGRYCQHICAEDEDIGCKEKLFCLPDPFGCSCAAGCSGTICSYECRSGFYGHDCALPCHCIDNKCSSYTGNCTVGCSSGWTGLNCQVECGNGTYGSNCNETCGLCSGGPFVCDRITGYCPRTQLNDTELLSLTEGKNTSYCELGFRPPICKEGCLNGTWSLDCNKACHCANNTGCDVLSGFCQTSFDENGEVLCEPGWTGNACNETCPEGFYGENCMEECGYCKDNTTCHPISGACVASRGACEPGYETWKCDKECETGYFGTRCTYVCNCANGTNCDHITGACDGFCLSGWTGTNCHEACPFGTYGLNCSQECTNCKSVPPNRRIPLCDLRFGKCTAGCTKAWSGDRCNEGILCDQNPCFNDGTCQQSGDFYSCQCSKAFSGSHCEKRNPPCQSQPCLNNGSCVEVNSKTFKCDCAENFEGETCEIDTKKLEPTSKPTQDDPKSDDKNGNDDGKTGDGNNETSTSDKDDDNSVLIIAAMALGAVVVICTIAFALKTCFKKPSTVMAEPQFAPIPMHPNPEVKTPSQVPLPTSFDNPSTMYDEITPEARLPKEPNYKNNSPETNEQERNDFQQFQIDPEEQSHDPCSSSSADASHLSSTDTQENSITFTETTTTQEKFSDSIEPVNQDIASLSPFLENKKLAFDKPITPPIGPSDISSQAMTINQKPKKRRFSRRKVQMRFSENSLDGLDEITRSSNEAAENQDENFANELKHRHSPPPKKTISVVEARATDPWDFTKAKIHPGPTVYGVAHRDVNMLITTPRSADEEFEMESRKGPVTERGKPTQSRVFETK